MSINVGVLLQIGHDQLDSQIMRLTCFDSNHEIQLIKYLSNSSVIPLHGPIRRISLIFLDSTSFPHFLKIIMKVCDCLYS
jgi:hypothetical protein